MIAGSRSLVSYAFRARGFLVRLVRDALLIAGMAAILFALINYAAYVSLPQQKPPSDLFSLITWPGSPASIDLYRRIFRLAPDEDPMGRFKASPNFAMHPTLPFVTQTINNRYFRVGLEGIRYEPDWNDAQVAALLSEAPRTIFVLGGSTTLGHGVAGDETWPYFLNRIVADGSGVGRGQAAVVINLGAQAYDQRMEIDKLIYLLKIGYRPSKVVLFDGWNDLFLARSNMRLVDKVIYHGFAVNRGDIAFTPAAALFQPSFSELFLQSLPIYRLIQSRQSTLEPIESVKMDRNAFIDGFGFKEADYLFRYWAEFGEQNRERFEQEIVEYYQRNLKLLKALADAYGFTLQVFLQPIGLFDDTNLFVPPTARTAPGYRYIAGLFTTVRAAIARGELDMIDVSEALNSLPEPRYLDVAHYTPASNKELARDIAPYVGADAAIASVHVPTATTRVEYRSLGTVTQVLPADPAVATINDGASFLGYQITPKKAQSILRVRVVANAYSADANEAVVAIFREGQKVPVRLESKSVAGRRARTVRPLRRSPSAGASPR